MSAHLTVRILGFYDMKERKMVTENSSSRGPTYTRLLWTKERAGQGLKEALACWNSVMPRTTRTKA